LDQSPAANAGESAAGVKEGRHPAERGRKPYLHIVLLPKGGVLLELEPRGGGSGAAAAELVVDAVRRHRECSGGGG